VSDERTTSGGRSDLRTVIHDLRQPLSALQVWVDLLADALRDAGDKEQRYLGKIRGEVTRMAELLARSSAAANDAPVVPRAESPAPPPSAQEGSPLAGTCLLVVEDDEVTAEALQLTLEGEGATVVLATTVTDALALHEASRPDVVLSDLRIGDGDGCALLVELRRSDAAVGRRTAAIAVTGFDQPDTRAAARAAGFDEVVVKPFSLPQLVEAVRRLLPSR
jgi:CheY-like chemotaxis protein